MDKVTSISYILYQSANSPETRKLAIQLLNGDLSLRDLKKNVTLVPEVNSAELLFKKKKIDLSMVQDFAEKFLFVEA